MSCIKTGCTVWVETHSQFFRGDAFLIGGLHIFRLTEASMSYQAGESIDFFVHHPDQWFDRHATYSTLLSTSVTRT